MGDLGIASAYGAAGASDELQKILAKRIEEKRYADLMEQRKFENLIQTRRLDQADQERKDALTETAYQHRQAEGSKNLEDTFKAADVIPPGSEMRFTSPMAGRLSSIGQTRDKGIAGPEPPASIAAPGNQPMGEMAGTIANAPFPGGRIVTKLASAKQQDTAADNERQSAASNAAIDAKIQGLNQAAERLKMQGDLNAANILLKQAQAAASEKKAGTINLSQGGKSAKAAIEQAAPLTDRVMEMIRQEAPDIETNPQKYNGVMAKGHSVLQTMKYKAGFADDTDPRQQLVSLLQPIQAGQYTRSSRSRQMLDLALKHMADPSQTLLTQYQRAKELKAIMPEMLEGIVRAEQPVDPSNPLGGSYFDPAKKAAADPLGIRK